MAWKTIIAYNKTQNKSVVIVCNDDAFILIVS